MSSTTTATVTTGTTTTTTSAASATSDGATDGAAVQPTLGDSRRRTSLRPLQSSLVVVLSTSPVGSLAALSLAAKNVTVTLIDLSSSSSPSSAASSISTSSSSSSSVPALQVVPTRDACVIPAAIAKYGAPTSSILHLITPSTTSSSSPTPPSQETEQPQPQFDHCTVDAAVPGLLLDGAVLAAASRAAVRATRNIVVVAADEVCEDAVTFTADGWVRLVIKAAGKSRSLRSKLIVSDGPLASLVEARAAADILAASAAEKTDGGNSEQQQQSGEDATATKKGVDSSTSATDGTSGGGDATTAVKKTETQVVSAIAVDTKMGIAGALLGRPCAESEYQSPVVDVPVKVDPTAAAALLAAAAATITPGTDADADNSAAAIAARDAVAFTSACGLSLLAGAQLSATTQPSSSSSSTGTPSSDAASTVSTAISTTWTGRPFALRANREHALWRATTTDAVYAALDEVPLPGETKARLLFPLAAARDLLMSLKRVAGDSGSGGKVSSFFSTGPLTSGLPCGFQVGKTGAVLFVGCMEDGHVLSKLVHVTSPTCPPTSTSSGSTDVTAASVAAGFVRRQGPQRAARNWLAHEADAAWAKGDVAKSALFKSEGIRRWPGFKAEPGFKKAWGGDEGENDVAEVVAKEQKTRVGVAVMKTVLVAVPVVVGLKVLMAMARAVSGAGRWKRDGDE